MKPTPTFFLLAVLGSLSNSLCRGATVLVDDFSDLTLTEYTQTRILDSTFANVNISFSASTGALGASYSGTPNAAEQVVILRDDYTLGVGETLTVDVSQATSTSDLDLGIVVATTKSPTAVSSLDLDTRDTMQWASVYIRPNQNAVRSLSYDGTTLVSGTGVLTADETTVAKLWIKRDSANTFSLGYINTSATSFTSKTVTMGSSSVGAAIGFYADLRVAGGTLGTLDNLTIIPEPSTAILAGLTAIGLGFRRKR
ncbi:MAG: PEP-CTERM sorting domain-containing protein [Luteolibacter sp.]|uniref:PEP-CTERM sorting domain-containing protein n=1 Tax=Luteolibacter sp. TaxID=1962973 RepID=UPI0032674951